MRGPRGHPVKRRLRPKALTPHPVRIEPIDRMSQQAAVNFHPVSGESERRERNGQFLAGELGDRRGVYDQTVQRGHQEPRAPR